MYNRQEENGLIHYRIKREVANVLLTTIREKE
jgi:hypothetical protein